MNFKNITTSVTPAAGVAVGAIAANKVSGLIPVGNDMVRNGAVVLVGLFLSGKKGFIGNVGLGMAASGISNLVSTYVPGITGFDTPVFVTGTTDPGGEDGGQPAGYAY